MELATLASWVAQNKLKAVGALWSTGIVASMAYQWSRNIPFQLKLIHSRIWAQGLTISAICASGAITQYSHHLEVTKLKGEVEVLKALSKRELKVED